MIEAPNANDEEQFVYALVPLRSAFLRQASLFDGKTYPLPKVLPGRAAVIVDSDEGWQDNFKRGMVTNYDFLTGLHTIQIESLEELDCCGIDIRRAFRSQLFLSIVSRRTLWAALPAGSGTPA